MKPIKKSLRDCTVRNCYDKVNPRIYIDIKDYIKIMAMDIDLIKEFILNSKQRMIENKL